MMSADDAIGVPAAPVADTDAGAAGPSRARRAPIPVTILTGFLGAGKTTLLNALLNDPALKEAAVIVNEFGDVGIDHLLVAASSDGIIELSSGCLCCTVRGELVTTLENLLRGLDNGRIATLSRVVIETTGLADPAPVMHAIMLHPYLVQRFRLDGVVTVVDALNGAATLDAHEEAVKQAAVADRLVLTKTDMAGGAEAGAALRRRLQALNPAAPILEAARGEATAERLLDCGLYDPKTKIADVARWLAAEAYGRPGQGGTHDHGGHDHHDHDHDHGSHDHHHDGHVAAAGHDHDHGSQGHGHGHGHGHHDHVHDVNRHDARIRSFSLITDRPIPMATFDMFLDLLRSAHGTKLLRMKGIVGIAEDPDRPLVIHAVQHAMHPPTQLPSWPGGDRRTRLVFITCDLPEAFVRGLFDAFTGVIAPDRPDAAAMTNNPLAIPGFRA
ncbi:GTP-binding protein [Pseudoxanthobacter sp. M-2]|uniref:CobW family GTP-binding protein n=1 Tax=Pseudoxanthobacter sp. M-2 TaxID=3078754 RepID=UPI0038FCD467